MQRRMRRDSLIDYAARSVPRYTSYPTAAQFTGAVGAREAESWMRELGPSDRVSLYVHLPFCARMCWYCACHALVANDYRRVQAYLERLHSEIEAVAGKLPQHGGIAGLHFGGGTPTLLAPADFERLAETLRSRFGVGDEAEIAVEVDPRSFDAEMAGALSRAGVSRVSLGVQDFEPEVQQAIGRVQPYEMVARTIDLLHAHGIHRIGFDLLYGLPGQSEAGIAGTAERAAGLWPDRLAVYGYAHLPEIKRHQQMIDAERLPDAAGRLTLAEAVEDTLSAEGYRPVGFDHYAWPSDTLAVAADRGYLHRNFQGYTDDPSDAVIGLGVSAISSFASGYAQNSPDLKAYRAAIDAGRLATARGIVLSREDRLRRAVIERLMCDFRVDLPAQSTAYGFEPDALDDAFPALDPLMRDGLITLSQRQIAVTELGRRFVRHVAHCFDTAGSARPARYSRAV